MILTQNPQYLDEGCGDCNRIPESGVVLVAFAAVDLVIATLSLSSSLFTLEFTVHVADNSPRRLIFGRSLLDFSVGDMSGTIH